MPECDSGGVHLVLKKTTISSKEKKNREEKKKMGEGRKSSLETRKIKQECIKWTYKK